MKDLALEGVLHDPHPGIKLLHLRLAHLALFLATYDIASKKLIHLVICIKAVLARMLLHPVLLLGADEYAVRYEIKYSE